MLSISICVICNALITTQADQDDADVELRSFGLSNGRIVYVVDVSTSEHTGVAKGPTNPVHYARE